MKKKQARVQISEEMIPNWKPPGPDGVQGFRLKHFTSLHKNLVWHLNACLERETPQWTTKRRTALIQKDKSKRNEASNNCPITCLPLTWKLLTGIIADEIHCSLENEGILPEEQKAGPFRRFSTHVWQNARANVVRCAMVCDVYFPFSKTL